MPSVRLPHPGARPAAVVWALVVLVVVVRVPMLGLPAWADEAGFLQVAAGWHLGGGGTSLYGDHWVDRPPVLITLYSLADALGGLEALRLIGALAAGLTVLAVADLARTLSPGDVRDRARVWAATCSAALMCSPFHWAFMVDGEQLAAPLVAAGLALSARGLTSTHGRAPLLTAAGGVLATAALLTKQNFADVFVFVLAFVGLRLLGKNLGLRRAALCLLGFGAGVVAALVAVGAWTLAHGTSLTGVWYAMYAFRIDAAAKAPSTGFPLDLLAQLGWAALLSGLLPLLVLVLLGAAFPGRRDAAVGALLLVVAFDVVSVMAGAHYWLHYLVQPSVPVAALVGVLVARGAPLRPVALLAAVLGVLGLVVQLTTPPQTEEELVGRAVRSAAAEHDQLVTLLGRANVNLAAGLDSPYPYLWALPAHTLDPHRTRLKRLLSGPHRPAWVVSWRLRADGAPRYVPRVLRTYYRIVARVCGRAILLRKDYERPTPHARPRSSATPASRCRSVGQAPPILRDLPWVTHAEAPMGLGGPSGR